MCHNAKTGVTATLLTIIFEPKTAVIHERQTRFVLRHHQDTSSNKNQIFVFLPDTLPVRLLSSSFAFSFCMLQLSYLHIYFKAYYAYLCCTLLRTDVLSAATGGESCTVPHCRLSAKFMSMTLVKNIKLTIEK